MFVPYGNSTSTVKNRNAELPPSGTPSPQIFTFTSSLHLQPRHKRIARTIGRMAELELRRPVLHPEARYLEVVVGFRRIDAQHKALPDLAAICRRPLKRRRTRHTRHRQLITYNYTGNGKLKLAIMAYPDRQSLGDGGWQRLRCPCPPKNQSIRKNSTIPQSNFYSSWGLAPEFPSSIIVDLQLKPPETLAPRIIVLVTIHPRMIRQNSRNPPFHAPSDGTSTWQMPPSRLTDSVFGSLRISRQTA